MTERVIVVGKGAREHALAYRLARNSVNQVVRETVVVPGSDGIALTQPCVKPDAEGLQGIIELVKKLSPNLVVIGPEDLLDAGLSDSLREQGFNVFGPSQKATQIESSKTFMKKLAVAAKIPSAGFASFEAEAPAIEYLEGKRLPIVIKADGLCAGKGVVVAQTKSEAVAAVKTLLAMGPVVIEEFLFGVEMSAIALCSGDSLLLFPPVRDHKRLLDNDEGPNTGGMGVVGPLPQAQDKTFMDNLKTKVFEPALAYMRRNGTPFYGALFAGLMVDGQDVRLLEFNARFGDPETQALMYGIDVDLYPILLSIAKGESLSRYGEQTLWDMKSTAVITVAAPGYPGTPKAGEIIEVPRLDDGAIFMAGVARNPQGQIVSSGGRVLSCVASAESLRIAIRKSYDIVSSVSFRGAQYRTDIGRTLL